MPGNAKFRWFLPAPIILALLVIVTSPGIPWVGELEDAQEQVRQNPNDAGAHYHLGTSYSEVAQR
jgi:lipopolysaccharide export system protein LptC